ncbi:hypothetical protein B566_EDAN009208 [Ephemera danica]|nr:hypothetical protein B566_EDAN009208 [Ephemera danica]
MAVIIKYCVSLAGSCYSAVCNSAVIAVLQCRQCPSFGQKSVVNAVSDKISLYIALYRTVLFCKITAIKYKKNAISLSSSESMIVLAEGGFFRRQFKHFVHNWSLLYFHYPRINTMVLKDQRVKDAIHKAAVYDARESSTDCTRGSSKGSDDCEMLESTLNSHTKKHEKRAYEILQVMRSKLSDWMLRITSWVLYKLLPVFLSGVLVNTEDVEMLREAERKGIPMIFLPLHRSHLDYILVTFILVNNGIKAPIVAAGDNLMIPIFGRLLRGLGAFYIKRKIDPVTGGRDLVYRAVLHTYMVENLRAGHYVEFYIEGGRTRTGKTCMPKGGLLSVIVDAQTEKVIDDALIVPVSINYERIVDGNFIREQLGQTKIMESFMNACRAIWKMLNASYGVMRVDFSIPFSVKEMVEKYQQIDQKSRGNSVTPESMELINPKQLTRPPSTVSIYGTDVVVEEQRNVVDVIARHVIYDCDRRMAIMSTNAVAFLLLHQFRKGSTLDELASALDQFRFDVRTHDRDTGFSQSDDSVDVINHALRILGPGLVQRERLSTSNGDTIQIKPVTMVPNVIELSYYANGSLSLYALEAVIATAMCSLQPACAWTANAACTVTRNELLEVSKYICQVLQFEFIFSKPCQLIDKVLLDVIQDFVDKNYLQIQPTVDDAIENDNIVHVEHLEEEGNDQYIGNDDVKYLANEECRGKFRLLCSTLRSLLEGYSTCAACMMNLVGKQQTEKSLLQDIRNETELKLKHGNLLYAESLSVDPVRNALRLLQKWDIIECHMHEQEKVYYLKNEERCEKEELEKKLMSVISRLQALLCKVE